MNSTSFLQLTSFPSIIREYFQNSPEMNDDNALPRIFENNEVKIEFIKWVESHPSLVENTPRLYKALKLATDPCDKVVEQARNVNSLVLFSQNDNDSMNVEHKPISNDRGLAVIYEVLNNTQCQIDEFPANYALMALELLESGMIASPQLTILFSKCDSKGRLALEYEGVADTVKASLTQIFGDLYTNLCCGEFTTDEISLLHLPECFDIFMPLIYKHFNSEYIVSILSVQRWQGENPLHNPLIFKKAIPLLRRLNSIELFKLFSATTKTGRKVLHNELNLKSALEFLEDMDPRDRDALLNRKGMDGDVPVNYLKPIDTIGMKDIEGNTRLYRTDSFRAALQDLDELPIEDLFRVLKKQDCQGNIALHYPETFKLSLPFLAKLPEEYLVSLFSIKDSRGCTPLHYGDIYKLALPLLEKMPGNHLFYLFSIEYRSGNTPPWLGDFNLNLPALEKLSGKDLSYLVFKNALPRLEKMPCRDLIDLFLLKDRWGNTYLHYTETFKLALPFLEKLPLKDLVSIFSIKDCIGNASLHYNDILELALPLLEKLPGEDLIDLFSLKDNKGNTPLHYNDTFKLVLSLLEKLPGYGLVDLFSIRDSRDKSPLNCNERFELALPLIEKLSVKNLVSLFSIKDSKGSTPLHYGDMFKLVLPLLEKLPVENLVSLFSIKDSKGSTLLHYNHIFKLALPLIEKQPGNGLVDLFSSKDNKGNIPLHYKDILELALPLLEKLPGEGLFNLFSIKDSRGITLLHYSNAFKLALPLLEKLEPNILFALFSIQSNTDQTLLHNPSILKLAIPLLEKLSPKDLVHLFLLEGYGPVKDSEEYPGKNYKTALHNIPTFEIIAPFLKTITPYLEILAASDPDLLNKLLTIKDSFGNTLLLYDVKLSLIPLLHKLKLEPAQLIKYFSRRYNNGRTSIEFPNVFESILPLLSANDKELVIQLLSIKNAAGQIPLHNDKIIKMALPLLLSFSKDGLNQLFSIQDNEGNTILHSPAVFFECQAALDLYGKLRPEVFKIRNKSGFMPQEWEKIHPSQQWLQKVKLSTDLKLLSEKEYQEKSMLLKKNLDAMWDSFVFGDHEGDVPNIYLEIDIFGAKTIYSPASIKQALDVIIETMITRKAWLGTPPENDRERLHLFYCQMLTNFEQLLAGFSLSESAREKAGTLINIAKFQLEGRCAGAYQAEIEQAKMLAASNATMEESGFDVTFNKLACAALFRCIEEVVLRRASSDSHIYNRMLFLVGLAPVDDPLPNLNATPEQCLSAIEAGWTRDKIVSSLTQSIGSLGLDQLQYWFELQTPEDYGHDFLIKQKEVQQAEQKILQDLKAQLSQKGVGELLINNCLNIFKSTHGAALRIGSPARKFVSEAIFNKLELATTLEEIMEAENQLSAENTSDRNRKRDLLVDQDALNEKIKGLKAEKTPLSQEDMQLQADIRKEMKALSEKLIYGKGEFKALKLSAEARIKLIKLLTQANSLPTIEELEVILTCKQQFDNQLSVLAEKWDVSFVPRESGLPSRAVERLRRLDYAFQFFTEIDGILKLNKRGVVEILVRIGVLEKELF